MSRKRRIIPGKKEAPLYTSSNFFAHPYYYLVVVVVRTYYTQSRRGLFGEREGRGVRPYPISA